VVGGEFLHIATMRRLHSPVLFRGFRGIAVHLQCISVCGLAEGMELGFGDPGKHVWERCLGGVIGKKVRGRIAREGTHTSRHRNENKGKGG